MRHIRSVLTAAFLTFGAAAVASAQTSAPQVSTLGRHAAGALGRGRGSKALFKGIALNSSEKANLESVRAKYAPQMKVLRQQARPQMQAMREARQRGDTAAMRAMWQKNAPQRQQQKQLLDSERADLRGALTPANQTKFDANIQKFESRIAERGRRAHKSGAGATAAQG